MYVCLCFHAAVVEARPAGTGKIPPSACGFVPSIVGLAGKLRGMLDAWNSFVCPHATMRIEFRHACGFEGARYAADPEACGGGNVLAKSRFYCAFVIFVKAVAGRRAKADRFVMRAVGCFFHFGRALLPAPVPDTGSRCAQIAPRRCEASVSIGTRGDGQDIVVLGRGCVIRMAIAQGSPCCRRNRAALVQRQFAWGRHSPSALLLCHENPPHRISRSGVASGALPQIALTRFRVKVRVGALRALLGRKVGSGSPGPKPS